MARILGGRSGMPPAPVATRGKDFQIQRMAMGISLRSVARELGISHVALMRWEADLSPLLPERARRWRAAISACAEARALEIAHSGVSVDDLATVHGGQLLRSLMASRRVGPTIDKRG